MVSVLRHNPKNSDKYLEEAQSSGLLTIPSRKFRDIYYLSNDKYDLSDVTHADLSSNSLQEVPCEVGDWFCLVNLILARNSIRTIPEFFINFSLLNTLDLSNNLLVTIPSSISALKSLLVLRLQNNKISSLPNDIGQLDKCQELDVSGNEISKIPDEIGLMQSLFHLDVSRNQIEILPENISQLPLIYFNAASNRIVMIPLCYKNILSLRQFNVKENPLKIPSLHVLKYGRVHFFKALESDLARLQITKQSESKLQQKDQSFEGVINQRTSLSLVPEETLQFLDNILPEETSDTKLESELKADLKKPEDEVKSVETLEESTKTIKIPISNQPSSLVKNKSKQASVESLEKMGKSPKKSATKLPTKAPIPPPPLKLRPPKPIKVRKLEKRAIPVKVTEKKKLASSPKRIEKSTSSPGETQSSPRTHKPKVPIPSSTKLPQSKLSVTSSSSPSFPGYAPPASKSSDQTKILSVVKPRKVLKSRQKSDVGDEPGFTVRRKAEKMYEELELIENVRLKIEQALKIRLGNDFQSALSDGVVLCQLANYVKPRSITTIHIPSPAVRTLSLAKARRNVENFLEVCPRLGVKPKDLCTSSDIMHEKSLKSVVDTVNALMKNVSLTKNSSISLSQPPSVKVVPSFVHSQLLNKRS